MLSAKCYFDVNALAQAIKCSLAENIPLYIYKSKAMYKLLFCLSLILATFSLFAQNQLVVKISDAQNAQELAYANVYLKNNQIGSSSDLDGIAVINLKPSKNLILTDTLVCSYVGYGEYIVPINLRQVKQIDINLQPDVVALDEVVVRSSATNLSSKKILKKSLKSVKKNYPQQETILAGFYRELLKEEAGYVQLNEAFFELFHTPYPQKRYARKAWNAYYPTYATADYYPSEKPVIFRNAQYLRYWNTRDDQCKIIAARASEDWSKDEVEIVAENGPLDLSAIDKVKYQADFLDPKLVNKYTYRKVGAAYINDEACYILAFKPKKLKHTTSQDQGKKVKIPIYSGKLYISMNDFAVVRFECQLTKGAIPKSKYRHHLPIAISLSCNYSKRQNQWHLQKVSAEQILNSTTSTNIKHVKTLKRELWVQDVRMDEVQAFEQDFETSFIDRRRGNLRYFPVRYDSVFWENPENYIPLPKTAYSDLSAKKPLEKQFKDRFFQKDLQASTYHKFEDSLFIHQDTLIDNYAWLRNLKDSSVQAIIKAENKYFKNYFVPYKSDFAKARHTISYLTKTCKNQAVKPKKSLYKGFFDTGEYGIILEKEGKKSLVVNYELLCKNCQVLSFTPNQDTSLLAYMLYSSNGREVYIKDIALDSIVGQLNDIQEMQWLNPNLLLYTKQDASHRSYLVGSYTLADKKHNILRTTDNNSQEIEHIYTSKDKRHYFFTENYGDFSQLFSINQSGIIEKLYSYEDAFYTIELEEDEMYWYALVRTKDWTSAIIRASKQQPKQWETYLSYEKEYAIDDFKITPNYLVIHAVKEAVPYLYSHPKNRLDKRTLLKFPSEFYDISPLAYSKVTDKDSISIYYSSLNELDRRYDIDLTDRSMSYEQLKCYNEYVLKEQPSYSTHILKVPTKDGSDFIPLRISENTDPNLKKKGIILKVYGAYGAFNPIGYEASEALLMDEGYVIAQAHIRGSRAKGWAWYEAGKVHKKRDGIEDYIDCATYLSKKKSLPGQNIIAYGQSAGGTIIGAAINEAPQLFKATILDYPYLDVINTMRNDSLPLTSLEYEEWGNPAKEKDYAYIKTYCPYQNIKLQNYPAILLFAGSRDFQTPYWQVLNSVAKYRENTSENQDILVHIGNNGHVGSFGGGQRMKELLYQYLFLEKHIDN